MHALRKKSVHHLSTSTTERVSTSIEITTTATQKTDDNDDEQAEEGEKREREREVSSIDKQGNNNAKSMRTGNMIHFVLFSCRHFIAMMLIRIIMIRSSMYVYFMINYQKENHK
jgi:hypothetical protein